jgi:hypothetical protein
MGIMIMQEDVNGRRLHMVKYNRTRKHLDVRNIHRSNLLKNKTFFTTTN